MISQSRMPRPANHQKSSDIPSNNNNTAQEQHVVLYQKTFDWVSECCELIRFLYRRLDKRDKQKVDISM